MGVIFSYILFTFVSAVCVCVCVYSVWEPFMVFALSLCVQKRSGW